MNLKGHYLGRKKNKRKEKQWPRQSTMQYAPAASITKHTRQDNALEHPVSKSKHGLD